MSCLRSVRRLVPVALAAVCCVVIAGAGMAAAPATAAPEVRISFEPVSGGNQDRDLQYAPGEIAFRKSLERAVSSGAKARMAPGQSLVVQFKEVTLAGSFEPWRAPRADAIRFMTDAYPPRIALSFRWTGADGKVIREGDRVLTNLDYQRDPRAALSNDPLRFDKALLEAWLERELVLP